MRKNRIRSVEWVDEMTDLLTPKNSLTVQQALNVPAVTACVEFISGTVAMLPVNLYKRTADGVEQIKDKRYHLLNRASFDTLDVYQQRKRMIRDYLLKGAGYLYIDRTGNTVHSLRYVAADDVSATVSPDPIFRDVGLYVGGKRYEAYDFVHIARNAKDGFHGESVIDAGAELIKAAYNSILMENKTAKVGGNRRGIILAEKTVGEKVLATIKSGWKKMWNSYSSDEPDNTIVLENGLKFQETSSTFADMQLADLKRENAKEICKLFCVPPTVIDGTAAEDSYTSGIRTAIMPVVEALTAALNANLLLESEKEDHFWEIDISELLKGDLLKRYQAYEIGRRSGFLLPDEIRGKENLPAMGMDFVNIGLADVLYFPKTQQIYTPNTNAMANLGTGQGTVPLDPSGKTRSFEDDHPRAEDGRFTFKSGKGYDKDPRTGIVKVTRVVEGHQSPPIKAEAMEVIEHRGSDGKVKGRSYYDESGQRIKDVHVSDHGNPKQHPYGKHGEHANEFHWENGKPVSKTTRELNEEERAENNDILPVMRTYNLNQLLTL